MYIQSIKSSLEESSILEKTRETLVIEESLPEELGEELQEESSNQLSPLNVYNKLVKKDEPKLINSAEDFERFLITIVQDHLDNNEKGLETHRVHLENNKNRKMALHAKLREINIKINEDGTIAFLNGTQTVLSIATGVATVGSFLASYFTGGASLIAIPITLGFMKAWTSALTSFFQGRREQQQAEMLTIRHSHDLCEDDLKRQTKVISKSSEEWSKLAHTLANVIRNHGSIREQAVQNINRR